MCLLQTDCVKSVRTRSYSGPHFSCNFPHSDWIRRDTPYLCVFSLNAGKCGKNADQNNSKYGHFLRISEVFTNYYYCRSIWQVTSCITFLYQNNYFTCRIVNWKCRKMFTYLVMQCHLNSDQDLRFFLTKIQLEKNVTWHNNERDHGRTEWKC